MDEEANVVTCSICPDGSVNGQFFYDTDIGVDFSECEMPREFRNLKRSALRHIEARKCHMDSLVEKEQKLKAEAESLENYRKQLLDSKKLVEECNLLQQKWEEEKRELEQERLKWRREIQERV